MWAMAKRMFWMIAINIAIMMTLVFAFELVAQVFHLNMNAESSIWLLYSFIGFGGAFIGLAISRIMAKWSMGVKVIDPHTQHQAERKLLEMVYGLAQRAKLPKMPEVGVYDSPEVNAFATGPTKSRALVAVSTGLLNHMNEDAIEGVLGHEITHIANGDMVTMTLIQGLMNTMVLILARIIASIVAGNVKSERGGQVVHRLVFYMMQIVLSLLGSMLVGVYSRRREFRADAGGARNAGREKMLAGLVALRSVYGQTDPAHQGLAALKISGRAEGLMALLATHPPLEERIRRIETMPI